jgi:hypothetical protein
MGLVQGPQKLNEGSGKTAHPGAIDRGFTLFQIRVMQIQIKWNSISAESVFAVNRRACLRLGVYRDKETPGNRMALRVCSKVEVVMENCL